MALPLPLPVGPGGPGVESLGAINALAHNMLKRKWYGPDIESQINNRNALTEGQKITNQYLPEKLQLANAFAGLQNQWYVPNIQSEINQRNALTEGQNIKNNNPLIGMSGSAGQIGALMWLNNLRRANPIAYQNMMGHMINSNNAQGQTSFMPAVNQNADAQQELQSNAQSQGNAAYDPATLLNNLLTHEKLTPKTQQAIDASDVQAGYMPGTNKTQKISPELQKDLLTQLNPAFAEQEKLAMKEIQNTKTDLPKLEKTAKALERLIKIASNPKNKELFGHSGVMGIGSEFAANRFAKTTKNPYAGEFQDLILSPVMDVEQQLSSRGNQLALKTALANKANFSETQPVALSKLKSAYKKIQDAIKNSQSIIGGNKKETMFKPDDLVKVETPEGIKVMKYSEAIALGAKE